MTHRARRAGGPPAFRTRSGGIAVLACALLAGGGFGCSPPSATRGTQMQVEADVYSGRPNPRWTLDAAAAGELARRMGELPAARPAAPAEGLGYRGLVVTGLEGECSEVRVHGGQVRAECGGETRAYADAGRGLERWLLGTGEGRLEPATMELLRGQLGG